MFIHLGGERWDDRSWNKDYADTGREWDNSTSNNSNSYRDRTYEDDYEAEREDSDTESNHNSYSTSTNSTKKYKDSENNDGPATSDKRVNLTLNTAITKSPSKTNKPLKKVDLGAAANFGRSGTQSPTPQTTNDLLNDDFNPRDSVPTQSNSSPDFGDFEKAFSGATEAKKEDDDFADFSSAFSGAPQQVSQPPPPSSVNLNLAAQPPLLGGTQPNLLGNLFASPPPQQSMMFAAPAVPTLISPPQINNNANDLLGGFSSLNIQSQQGFGSTGAAPIGDISGPKSLLDGFDSGWYILLFHIVIL